MMAWRTACVRYCGTKVLRTAILSIVLTLGLGQNATSLCWIWCHPAEPVAGVGCQHHDQASSSRVTDNEVCKEAVAPITFVREDNRPEHFGPSLPTAVVVPAFAASSRTRCLGKHSVSTLTSDSQTLILPLRI